MLGRAEAALRAALARLRAGAAFEVLLAASEAGTGGRLGAVLLLAGRPRDALAAFAEALRAEPGSAAARAGAAEALLELGQPAKALETVEAALGEAPDGWIVAAAAAHALGAAAEARAFLAEAARRSGIGFDCVHRRARQAALEAALGA
ncbi:MAG: tetratricopeptide repeat protein [Anaeromyxobacteraceae bacterium]